MEGRSGGQIGPIGHRGHPIRQIQTTGHGCDTENAIQSCIVQLKTVWWNLTRCAPNWTHYAKKRMESYQVRWKSNKNTQISPILANLKYQNVLRLEHVVRMG